MISAMWFLVLTQAVLALETFLFIFFIMLEITVLTGKDGEGK